MIQRPKAFSSYWAVSSDWMPSVTNRITVGVRGLGPRVRRVGPILLGLWGIAVAQPLLDLLGRTPEFFIANGLEGPQLVWFALSIVLVGPLSCLLVVSVGHLIDARLGDGLVTLFVGALAAAFVVALLVDADVEHGAASIALGVVVGAGVAYAQASDARVEDALRYLGFAPLLFLSLFLFTSESGELLWGDRAAADSAAVIDSPAPVVLLTLDELPTSSLLTSAGAVNDSLFPNFARLGDVSTFYRSASSVAGSTTSSLPTILTGLLPDGDQTPLARDHPRSLFTLLGDQYDQRVIEQVTDLCPGRICADGDGFQLGELRASLLDSAAIYAQAAVPPSMQHYFPAVDQAWAGFVGGNDDAPVAIDVALADALRSMTSESAGPVDAAGDGRECPDARFDCGAVRFAELIESIEPAADESLIFGHVTVPHSPWLFTATGRQYLSFNDGLAAWIDEGPGGELDAPWVEDEEIVRQNLQRHLMQVGFVDLLLGRLIDKLEASGIWDRALVIVVADHGVSFTPGMSPRWPEPGNRHEIYNVPLFVKQPNQTEGSVSDINALTVDILPTIVDVLDIRTEWVFDGQSLVGGKPRQPDKPLFEGLPEPQRLSTGLPPGSAPVLTLARRNDTHFPHGNGWRSIVAVGRFGGLVGETVDRLAVQQSETPVRIDRQAVLNNWDPEGTEYAPIYLRGQVDNWTQALPDGGLVALNGTIAGAAVVFETTGEGVLGFSAVIEDRALHKGYNDLTLLLPAGPDGRTFTAYRPGA